MFRTLILFIFTPTLLLAQTQEDFQNKYMEVYMNVQDTAKAKALALEAYEMLNSTDSLQTSSNYYIIRAAFDLINEDELVKEAEKKAQARIEFNYEVVKPESYQNAEMEWAYEYSTEFYKSDDPALARKAIRFLGEHPELINFTNYSSLASFYERLYDFENANKYYGLAFDHVANDELMSLTQPAIFYLKTGQYQRVDELLVMNQELLDSANQYYKVSYELSLSLIAMYYHLFIGDFKRYAEEAQSYYENQIEMSDNDLVTKSYAASIHIAKALSYEFLRQYDLAKEQYENYEESTAAYLKTLRETYPNYYQESLPILDIYNARLGDLTNRVSKVDVLNSYYSYVDQFTEPTLDAWVQRAINYALFHDQRYPEIFDEVLATFNKTKNFNEATRPYAQYAYFLMRDREWDEAGKLYRELFEQNLEWINDLIFTFGEKAFVAFFTTKLKEGYDDFHSFVKLTSDKPDGLHRKLVEQAYDNLLLTKSIAFKGVRRRKEAFVKSNDPRVVSMYSQWLESKQRLIRLYQMSQQDNKDLASSLQIDEDTIQAVAIPQNVLDSLQEEVDKLENQLATSASGFKETLKISSPNWKEVKRSLAPGEAAIEITRFQWKDQIYYSDSAWYAAYIVKHDSDYPEVVYLPALASELDTRYYNLYRNSINLKVEDNTSYKQYWQAIKYKLEGIDKVYFSPDGIFHLINLPTLKNPDTDQYLLEELKVINVTSTGNIGVKNESKRTGQAVLIGRPKYSSRDAEFDPEGSGARSFTKDFRNASVDDLPGTQDEVETIALQLSEDGVQVTQLLGDEATEDQVQDLVSPDILHFATHGFWSGTEEATSGYRIYNAMMNSGLLLAGVVDYYSKEVLTDVNDGILTAFEAQNLQLESTDLVVLSACETGLGDFDAGEGVYGLQRAFRAAGAQSIISTLWKVDDQGTKDFMILFYEQMLQTGDRQEAFRSTQLAMKAKYRDPYYWGAFVLTGS